MSRSSNPTIHEVDFCGQIAAEATILFRQDPQAFPFVEARLEGFGSGSAKRRRKDLRFYDASGRLALCGEVKLPGSAAGRSPYDEELVYDAHQKADDAGVQYFFTWNVNVFVLWDRSQWDVPLLERRVREWRLGLDLASPEDVARPETLHRIKTAFLPDLLRDLADIYSGRRRDWSMPPDDLFIRSLESHLDWPVQLTTAFLAQSTDRNRTFDDRVQRWLAEQDRAFVRGVREEWHQALLNMARTLAYVWANRLIFYKALRARFSDLPRLELKRSVKSAAEAVEAFNRFFGRAVERSGDYEPLLFPDTEDWATELVFQPPAALDAWRGLLRGIESVDFRDVPSDVVGRIFQKLISPEERHRFGQHFTGDDVVDLINAFCIRRATDAVLDPACGSGSFLVRAYYRKRYLDRRRAHADQLAELFGCDIALYPAHLATLNLAAREINDEANYPRIARRDFFDTVPDQPFCTIPGDTGGEIGVTLPPLDAVVGNPPYVRQEKIDRHDKARYADLAQKAWLGTPLSGRSDLHCYFWPVAASWIKSNGRFGFLTSSSWLDVEYGFALQGWILRHFKLLAVMESAAEPWFPDARVKTAIVILERCDDEAQRMGNLARFVRFTQPLKDIIGVAPADNEAKRQRAVELLRERILRTVADAQDDQLRVVVKRQHDLWNDGVRAGRILKRATAAQPILDDADNRDKNDESEIDRTDETAVPLNGGYVAGKWGRYVRAPDFYFEIMRRFGNHFVPLGEIVDVRFGVKSGCDAFFMPTDITDNLLHACSNEREFRGRSGGAARKDVESGALRIIRAGDGSVHPIEAEFLRPEIHSLMKVDRPIVRPKHLNRVVLLVGQPLKELRGTWVHKYIRYGEEATFSSKKSKAGPVPQRSTCAARDPWYDLTKLVRPGFALWPKSQQYRHIVPANPKRAIANCNLYDISSHVLSRAESKTLVAILNSTLVALLKTFYGRFAGTEGNLKTEIIDVDLMDVPDPRGVDQRVAACLHDSLEGLSRRPVGRLVEEQLMDCHSPERARRLAAGPLMLSTELTQRDRLALDDAVFELLGVSAAAERARLVNQLYKETAVHFRAIRVVEIEKMEQRGQTGSRRFNVQDLAADAWDAAELEDATPLVEWIAKRPECDASVHIPEERPAEVSRSPMFDPNTVYFGKRKRSYVDCQSRGQAELIARLANLGISGTVAIPAELAPCVKLLDRVDDRIERARKRFVELASSRAGDERLRDEIVAQLLRWFVLGRGMKRGSEIPQETEEDIQ
jgi:methylase of polypeptide subunit release factors